MVLLSVSNLDMTSSIAGQVMSGTLGAFFLTDFQIDRCLGVLFLYMSPFDVLFKVLVTHS